VRRLLLSPRWLAGHLLVAILFAGCLWLGWWQWGRARSGGGFQNLGYALQWPLFAAFFIFGWIRIIRLELSRRADGEQGPAVADPDPVPAGPPPAWHYEPPVIDDSDDEELAAYNRHLAALHERDQHRQS
jgi:hypothetical protein